ncbi:glycosyltransferase family 2 protein [Linnemannia elongata AG-77]|uniref:chitin synthase n=1 Tax=Linnemannia elongata AG-77 TaxID=1314771 RepID=A0A197JXV4_9FUNG|nr:glycosyltransferase family 2 protein [Linnemannia elongata AG-77]
MTGIPSGPGGRSTTMQQGGGGLQSHGTIRRGGTLNRGKTLSRPDRFQTPETMFKKRKEDEPASCWVICSRITTCWALPPLLRMCGMPDKQVQQAWREKVTLCVIILLIGGMVAFLTIGFSFLLCPKDQRQGAQTFVRYGDTLSQGRFGIYGNIYDFNLPGTKYPNGFHIEDLTPGQDVSNLFRRTANTPSCVQLTSAAAKFDNCLAPGGCDNNFTVNRDILLKEYNIRPSQNLKAGYDWGQMAMPELVNYMVIDGNVLNLDRYFAMYKNPIANDELDTVLRNVRDAPQPEGGRDATKIFFRRESLKDSASCLVEKFGAGYIDKATPGCFASDLFMFVSLTVVLGIVMSRFAMAIIFDWFLSAKLAKPPSKAKIQSLTSAASSATTIPSNSPSGKNFSGNNGALARAPSGPGNVSVQDLHTCLLVTCYSEGESSLRTTIESLAATEYPDNKKLLFIICDGIITGSGNDRSTPDICSSLMELDPAFDSDPTPQSYIAVAAGSKQHNRAKVYAGYFRWKNRRVPTVLVVKCGNEEEHEKPKAGNRGKRDSQLILMNFFSRVTYNDRMTPLDYELFRKIQHLMQVTPDKFEIVLMVDADTKVYPSSLRLLMNCMNNDPLIMGLCGETKIANKRQSWVTAIQVFEYYISHHLGKGFESVFGGVTCLPGCFCMYRLKARKGVDWVPIITKPEIVQEYSQNIVETLHQKNLLLLGEDRFLTTLMLRNFPNRKMMFMPQAICKTVVPDEFNVLLSQRRRWINSTIHNLLELVLVRNLCGTFCFSMQFVILMELIGTVVLPVAMILTVVLIVNLSVMQITNLAQAAPLILLVFVLTMPAILILLTTRKLIYIAWMFVYLLALPVWNFVLPLYAYWHFDDFSWGETRKVAGEAKGEAHGNADGNFDSSKVPLKRWDDYEKARVRQVKRIERAERQRIQGTSPFLRAQAGTPTSMYTDIGDSKSEVVPGEYLGPQQYHSSSSHDDGPSWIRWTSSFSWLERRTSETYVTDVTDVTASTAHD